MLPAIIIAIILLAIGFYGYYSGAYNTAIAMLLLSVAWLSSALLILPVKRYLVLSRCREFTAAKEFYETKAGEAERNALALKAVEQNQWLANARYWKNSTLFSIFWPDEVNSLEMIKQKEHK
jgi:hypothetical protein